MVGMQWLPYVAYEYVSHMHTQTHTHTHTLSLPPSHTHTHTHTHRDTQSWVGHPYFDVVDNSTNFNKKISRVIEKVCTGIEKRGVELNAKDRLEARSRKRKFLIKLQPDDSVQNIHV